MIRTRRSKEPSSLLLFFHHHHFDLQQYVLYHITYHFIPIFTSPSCPFPSYTSTSPPFSLITLEKSSTSSHSFHPDMFFTSVPGAVLTLCLSILAVRRGSAQTVSPTNDTSSDNNVTMFTLATTLGGMDTKTNIGPLTPQAGMIGSLNQLEVS